MKAGSAAYGPTLRHRALVVCLEERYLRRFPLWVRVVAWVVCAGAAAMAGGPAWAVAGPVIGEALFLAFTLARYVPERADHRRRARLAQKGSSS
jgi:Flp pilus assembly protein TadB